MRAKQNPRARWSTARFRLKRKCPWNPAWQGPAVRSGILRGTPGSCRSARTRSAHLPRLDPGSGPGDIPPAPFPGSSCPRKRVPGQDGTLPAFDAAHHPWGEIPPPWLPDRSAPPRRPAAPGGPRRSWSLLSRGPPICGRPAPASTRRLRRPCSSSPRPADRRSHRCTGRSGGRLRRAVSLPDRGRASARARSGLAFPPRKSSPGCIPRRRRELHLRV